MKQELFDRAPEPRRLLGLQYLRGIAATGVVVFHATEAAGTPWRLGAHGVDLFFVLSGFVMIAIAGKGASSLTFFKDRLLRVVPLYWIVTATLLAFALAGLAPFITPDPARVATSFAFIPYGEVKAGRMPLPILAVGWTLNIEILFYTLFALILVLPRRRMTALTCAIGGLVLAGIVYRPPAPFVAWTHPILLEFVMGGWVGVAWLRPRQRRRIVPCLLLAMLPWLFLSSGRAGTVVTLILMAVLVCEERGTGVPKWRPLLLLGDASYSIYLWQIFALEFALVIGRHLHVPPALIAIAASLGAVGGGIIAYLLIERPLLAALRRRRIRHGITIPAGP